MRILHNYICIRKDTRIVQNSKISCLKKKFSKIFIRKNHNNYYEEDCIIKIMQSLSKCGGEEKIIQENKKGLSE